MKRIIALTLILILLLSMRGCSQQNGENSDVVVKSIDKTCLNSNAATAEELKALLNKNIRYLLNEWWNSAKPEAFYESTSIENCSSDSLDSEQLLQVEKSQQSFQNWRDEEYLDIVIGEGYCSMENSIRPLSHVCDVVAISLLCGYYDEKLTGVSEADAKAMLIKLIASAAHQYSQGAWGKNWQSALWAENIGFAAWTLWDEIDEKHQSDVLNMILTEAGCVLNREIPYYRDVEGNELSEGDTKGEEIAWDSKILALAVCMFPEHPDNERWENKLKEMLIAATATPEDVGSNESIDGVALSDFLEGSNINSDGTVVNHNSYHVDYMTTIIEEMTESVILYKLAGREPLTSSLHNVDLIYDALVNVDLGKYDKSKVGQHFYKRDSSGNISGKVTMPGTNDWGGNWYANYYLTDIYADAFNMDRAVPEQYQASQWAYAHLKELIRSVSREESGKFFQDGENYFVSGEMFQMHNLSKAYELQQLFN